MHPQLPNCTSLDRGREGWLISMLFPYCVCAPSTLWCPLARVSLIGNCRERYKTFQVTVQESPKSLKEKCFNHDTWSITPKSLKEKYFNLLHSGHLWLIGHIKVAWFRSMYRFRISHWLLLAFVHPQLPNCTSLDRGREGWLISMLFPLWMCTFNTVVSTCKSFTDKESQR